MFGWGRGKVGIKSGHRTCLSASARQTAAASAFFLHRHHSYVLIDAIWTLSKSSFSIGSLLSRGSASDFLLAVVSFM